MGFTSMATENPMGFPLNSDAMEVKPRRSYIRVVSIHSVALVSFLLFNVYCSLGCVNHREIFQIWSVFVAHNLGYSITHSKKEGN